MALVPTAEEDAVLFNASKSVSDRVNRAVDKTYRDYVAVANFLDTLCLLDLILNSESTSSIK